VAADSMGLRSAVEPILRGILGGSFRAIQGEQIAQPFDTQTESFIEAEKSNDRDHGHDEKTEKACFGCTHALDFPPTFQSRKTCQQMGSGIKALMDGDAVGQNVSLAQ
jgi:hypothetical protein